MKNGVHSDPKITTLVEMMKVSKLERMSASVWSGHGVGTFSLEDLLGLSLINWSLI